MIRVFIGFDPRETVAYHVLCQSILSRSSEPVSFTPLLLSNLKRELWRERHPLQSTDFSFSRFLTPHLCGFEGWSLFMDCDMLCMADIAELWALRDERYAVMCVQHRYEVKESTKFLGEKQTAYEKKNWSSVMLFNNARCQALTPDFVNTATGLELHQFKWLENDGLIGPLPQHWNHLVGVHDQAAEPAFVHFTLGGPYFPGYAYCERANDWRSELQAALVPTV